MGLKLACSTACFRHASIDVALEEIRRLGFHAIDLSLIPGLCDHFDISRQPAVEREDFGALVRNSGLLVPTITAAPGDFNSRSDNFEFIVQSALAHLKLAAELAAEGLNVTCGAPVCSRDKFRADATVQAEGLRQIAREAARLGLTVNVWAPHADGLCRNLDQVRFLLEQVNQDNVRLLLDAAQLAAARVSPAEALDALAGRVGHVRLTECPGVDLPAFCGALLHAGYGGYCALELPMCADIAEVGGRLRQTLLRIRPYFEAILPASIGANP